MAKTRKMTKRAPARAKAKARPKVSTSPSAKKVSPVPAGYHTATPYLTVNDGNGALEFYKRALGAREVMRMAAPGGKIGHAEIRIGDSHIMLSDEFPGTSTKAPTSLGGTTGSIMLYLPNVDAAFKKAIDAGCKSIMAPTDMFWGDRFGKLEDPYGNQWAMATHKEDVPPKQMAERAKASMAAMAQGQGNA